MKEFDFEYWANLSRNDPEAFEVERRKVLEEVIATAPDKEQELAIRRLQWRIDAERQIAKNPLDSCVRIYNMLIGHVYKKGGFIDAITSLSPDQHIGLRRSILPETKTIMRVIPFKPKE